METEKVSRALKQIIYQYPTAINNRSQMKALLLDFLPNERMAQNILLMVLDEGIAQEIQMSVRIDSFKIIKYIKTLTTYYGITEDNAKGALCAWSEALCVEIEKNNATFENDEHVKHDVEWHDSGDTGDYEYEQIDGGIRITKFIGFDESEIIVPNMIGGKKVIEIGNYAFRGCISIKKIVISEGVEKIGNGAFKGNSALKEIILPETLKSIGSEDTNGYLSKSYGKPEVEGAFEDTKINNVTIPKNISFIGKSTFKGCSSLESVQLPQNIDIISNGMFSICASLCDVYFPAKLKEIGDMVFFGCGKLEKLKLNEGLLAIGVSAFKSCGKLNKIYIPSSVQKIGTQEDGIMEKLLSVFDNASFGNSLTIYCEAGSYAMDYARRNGIKCAKASSWQDE